MITFTTDLYSNFWLGTDCQFLTLRVFNPLHPLTVDKPKTKEIPHISVTLHRLNCKIRKFFQVEHEIQRKL